MFLLQQSLFSEIPEREILIRRSSRNKKYASPFRYPGGKTWFVPFFKRWMESRAFYPSVLIEPFVGGGSVGLTALFDGLVGELRICEIDSDVASVWKTILTGDSDHLISRILNFEMKRELVMEELSGEAMNESERAFKTLLKNRTSFGGILQGGFLRKGGEGKGISSRWNPRSLVERIERIREIAHRIEFVHGNGIDMIEKYAENTDAVFFIDPPYTLGGKNAGKKLYRHSEVDHEQLFEACAGIRGDFLMTYHNSPEILDLAQRFGFDTGVVRMKSNHHETMNEIVIGR